MDKSELNDYENDVLEAIDTFKEDFKVKASNLQESLTIKDLETMLGELVSKTNKVYLDMTSDMLSEIDEQEVIALKKSNTERKE